MENANTWVQPTRFSGEYPNGFAGYTFLDFDQNYNTYHPGEDYNWGGGNDDLGQDVVATSSGVVIYANKLATGYGNMVVIKHTLGYNLKRYIKDTYGIDTNELYSLYAHLQDFSVKVGDAVTSGQVIAKVGNTGTTWAHLHFEIYAPIGDLAKTAFRFYPSVATGWTKEKTKLYYLPAYFLIEATKQLPDLIDSFLGKPKDYWLQVEKDRESLLAQVGEIDRNWAAKYEKMEKEKQIEISTLTEQVLQQTKAREQAEAKLQTETANFASEIEKKNNEITSLKSQISQLINDNADNYKFWDAIRLVFAVFKKKIGGEA